MVEHEAASGTCTCPSTHSSANLSLSHAGPAKDSDYTCLNGQEQWLTFGGQLEYALPSPEVNTGARVRRAGCALHLLAGPGGGFDPQNLIAAAAYMNMCTGVQTPALAAVQPAGGMPAGPAAAAGAAGVPGGAKVYRCIKGYAVNGTAMTLTQVSVCALLMVVARCRWLQLAGHLQTQSLCWCTRGAPSADGSIESVAIHSPTRTGVARRRGPHAVRGQV